MKKYFLFLLLSLQVQWMYAQPKKQLSKAMTEFNNDPQLQFATVGLYVTDGLSGNTVFAQNESKGMVTASTLKIITAATALDVLGKDYTYATLFGIVATPKANSLYIQASGDPTLGSWRWPETGEAVIIEKIKTFLLEKGLSQIQSVIICTDGWMQYDAIPNGWMWEDLGQYYGAGAQGLNWRENQFDLVVKTETRIGSPVSIVKTNPYLFDYKIVSLATAADKDSGDQSALFFPSQGQSYGVLKGSIPAGKNNFTVSGAIYQPAHQLAKTIIQEIKDITIVHDSTIEMTDQPLANADIFYNHTSPPLYKMVYWFLQKSINLYGEALLRTVAQRLTGEANTEKGITALQNYWSARGIHREAMHLYDGSGLSPQNRITPKAQVAVLKYAKAQSWFPEFYEALPLYNNMKMKSGTISRVKGFSGYQQSKTGHHYIFSMLINNYSGGHSSLVNKMYKVLNCLK